MERQIEKAPVSCSKDGAEPIVEALDLLVVYVPILTYVHQREESTEVVLASVPASPWTPPSAGVPGKSHREEAQGMLEGLWLSAGLGLPEELEKMSGEWEVLGSLLILPVPDKRKITSLLVDLTCYLRLKACVQATS
ncbi:hypothetical protein AMECASPLE_022119 [Ameca splendens]|uniref:Uncharacterized protein n=1 Tax=Ameca splendens TaxID=208324 RepID=A0ABV0YQL7_9TELE